MPQQTLGIDHGQQPETPTCNYAEDGRPISCYYDRTLYDDTGASTHESVPSHQSSYASDKYTDDGRPILFYVKALYDYQATIDEEFDFQADDIIAVTETPEDGWWSGELQIEKKKRQPGRHIFPSNLVSRHESVASHQSPSASGKFAENGRPILFYVKALYDYQATIDEEFNFQAGDIIAVTATPEDGWWRGELVDEKKRQHGRYVFPSNFVGLLP